MLNTSQEVEELQRGGAYNGVLRLEIVRAECRAKMAASGLDWGVAPRRLLTQHLLNNYEFVEICELLKQIPPQEFSGIDVGGGYRHTGTIETLTAQIVADYLYSEIIEETNEVAA